MAGPLKTSTAPSLADPTSSSPIKASLKYDWQILSNSVLHPWQPNSPPDYPAKSDPDGTGRLKFSPHLPERFPAPAVPSDPPPAPRLRAVNAEPLETRGKKSLLQQSLELLMAQKTHRPYFNARFEGPLWSQDGKMFPTLAISQAEALGPTATEPCVFGASTALPAVPPVPRTPLVLEAPKTLPPVIPAPPLTSLMLGASIPTDEERAISRPGALEREIGKKIDQEAEKRKRAVIMAPLRAPPMGSSSVHLPPYLRPICDLTYLPSTRAATIKRELRKEEHSKATLAVVLKPTQTHALVPRRGQEPSKANEENHGANAANVPPIENSPPKAQPCGLLPVATPCRVFDKSKIVHTNQVTECDISWWVQRDRALRISKWLRATKRRGRRNTSQVKEITHAPPVKELAARTHKVLAKKKRKGWVKRAASRRRVHTRKPLPSGSRLDWTQGALIQILVYIYHAFTLLILRSTAVTWLTELILSSGLVRGRIS